MRILVCGSREWDQFRVISKALKICREEYGDFWVIHGGCRGADQMAGTAALMLELVSICVPARWGREGMSAGPKRNQYMLDVFKPDFVLAFHEDWMSSKGTKDMITRAGKVPVPYRVISKGEDLKSFAERLPDA